MSRERLETILKEVAAGSRSIDEALDDLRDLPFEDMDVAVLDHHRSFRTGVPEVVYGLHKTPAQIAAIVERMVARDERAIVTRASTEALAAVQERFPEARYFETARIIAVGEFPAPQSDRFVAVVTAGTSDLPVAEEAAITLEWLGTRVERVYDVGVAGVHRLLSRRELLWQARRRDRHRRHGRRAGDRRRRIGELSRPSPCRPASAMAPASMASRRCWRC